MKEEKRRRLEKRIIRLMIEIQDIVVASKQARAQQNREARGMAGEEDRVRWRDNLAERARRGRITGRLSTWAITMLEQRRSELRAEAVKETSALKQKRVAEQLREERSQRRCGGEVAVTRAATGSGQPREQTPIMTKTYDRNKRSAQQRVQKLEKQIKRHKVQLDTGKETVARLNDEDRWRRGSDIPGGGWEIQFNRGWGGEEKWKPWLNVRPSGALRDARAPMSGDERGWGLYAARKFNAGDSIGTVTGSMLGDLGKVGSSETKATLQAMRAAGGGHHAIQVNGRLIDGARAASGVQYANSPKGAQGRRVNSFFKRTGTLSADTQIEEGDEILVTWGEFWPPYQRACAQAEHVAADGDVEGGHAEHAAREDDDGKGSDEQPNSATGEHAVHDDTGAHEIAQQQTARAEEERLWNARAEGRIPRTATARVDGSGAREQVGGKRGRDSREANEQVIDEPGPSEAQQGGTEEDIAATAITAAHGTAEGEAAAEAEAKAEADKRAAEEEQLKEQRRKDEAERKRQKRERQWQENKQRALEQRERDRRGQKEETRDSETVEHAERIKRRGTTAKRKPPAEWPVRAQEKYLRRATSSCATSMPVMVGDASPHNVSGLVDVCLDAVT